MNFFKIAEGKEPVAVVFHDYLTGSCVCRSKKESFLKSFEAIQSVELLRIVKEPFEGGLASRLVAIPVTDSDYAEAALNMCLGGFWSIAGSGTCLNNEEDIDGVVGDFLV